MLQHDVLTAAQIQHGVIDAANLVLPEVAYHERHENELGNDENEAGHADGPHVTSFMKLASKKGKSWSIRCSSTHYCI